MYLWQLLRLLVGLRWTHLAHSVSPVCGHSSSHGMAWLFHLAGDRLPRVWRVHALLSLKWELAHNLFGHTVQLNASHLTSPDSRGGAKTSLPDEMDFKVKVQRGVGTGRRKQHSPQGGTSGLDKHSSKRGKWCLRQPLSQTLALASQYIHRQCLTRFYYHMLYLHWPLLLVCIESTTSVF